VTVVHRIGSSSTARRFVSVSIDSVGFDLTVARSLAQAGALQTQLTYVTNSGTYAESIVTGMCVSDARMDGAMWLNEQPGTCRFAQDEVSCWRPPIVVTLELHCRHALPAPVFFPLVVAERRPFLVSVC
jgi:hypothetical protein